MRLFIAIGISEDIKEYMIKVQKQIDDKNNKIRFANKNSIHLTLKFLGEVQPNKLEEIKNNLKKITMEPFSIVLDNIGVFPNESYIRVIWIGLKPEGPIIELQKDIDDNLEILFKKEKDFKPHLTLARVKYVEDKDDFINKLKNIEIENQKIDVDNFKLIKSTLSSEGPIYENLDIFR